MRQRVQKIGLIRAATLVALVGLALVVPSFIDWNNYRQQIRSALTDATGRDVAIEGGISFQLLPSPALSAEAVTIASMDGVESPYLASLNRLDVNVALLPLITGEIKVLSLLLDEPDIYLETLADGQNSWEFAIDGPEGASNEEGAALSVNDFIIQNGDIHYINRQTDQDVSVAGLSARIKANNVNGPFDATLAFTYQDTPVQIKAEMSEWFDGQRIPLSVSLILNMDNPGLQFSGTVLSDPDEWELSGRLIGQGGNFQQFYNSLRLLLEGRNYQPLQASVNLNQAWDLSSGIKATNWAGKLTAASFKVGDTNGTLDADWDFHDSQKQVANTRLVFKSLNLDQILVAADEDGSGDSVQDQWQQLWTSIPKDMPFVGSHSVGLNQVRYKGQDIRQSVLNFDVLPNGVKLDEFKMLLPGNADLYVSGTLKSQSDRPEFVGQTRFNTASLRDFLSWVEMPTDQFGEETLESFSIQSTLRAAADAIILDESTIQLDVSQFDGRLKVGMTNIPLMDINGSLNRLDLDPFLASISNDESDDSPQATLSDQLSDSLRGLDNSASKIALSIGQITYNQGILRDIVLNMDVGDGALRLHDVRVGSMEGMILNLKGQVTDLSQLMGLNLQFDVSANSLSNFAKWQALDLGFDPDNVGRFQMKGQVIGRFNDYQLNLEGEALRAQYTVAGKLNGPLENPNDIDLTLAFNHPGHLDLLRRIDMNVEMRGRSLPVDANLALRGAPHNLNVNGTMAALGGSFGLVGQLEKLQSDYHYKGVLDVRHPSVYELSSVLGVLLQPKSQIQQSTDISLTATLDYTPQRLMVTDLMGNVAGTSVSGLASAEFPTPPTPNAVASGPTKINADVSLGSLNLDGYLSEQLEGVEKAQQPGGARWSTDPIDLSFLDQVIGDFSLKVASFHYDRYNASDLIVNLTFSDSGIEWRDVSAKAWQGEVVTNGRFTRADQNQLTASLQLSNIQMDQASSAFSGLSPMIGQGNASFDWQSSGANQQELIENLSGTGQLQSQKVGLNGFSLADLKTAIANRKNIPEFLASMQRTLSGGTTLIENFDSPISFTNGQMKLTAEQFDTKHGKMDVNITANLGSWQVNGNLVTALSSALELPPIVLNISGGLGDPSVNWDTKALTSAMAQTVTQSLLTDLVQSFVPKGAENAEGAQPTKPADGASTITDAVKKLLEKNKKKNGGNN